MRNIVFDIETRNAGRINGKLDPLMLDISVVGVYDFQTNSYESYLQEDLPKLWPILEDADMLIGYNSDHFDIPLLNKYYPGDLTHIKSLDLLKEIRASLGKRLRLDMVADGTLGKGKSSNGLQAVTWWKNGEIDKLRKYCLDDVRITKEIYEYALEHGILKYKDLGQVRDIKIDTSQWDQKENVSMTHTLPF